MKVNKTYLFTADPDLAAPFLEGVQSLNEIKVLHLPLEHYEPYIIGEEEKIVIDKLSSFGFVVHGNLRNARYFLRWVSKNNLLEEVRQSVHLVLNKPSLDLLESHTIPAILPRNHARPIDIIEFMLRISKEGSVLYPTTDEKQEEIPGLLQELDMQVAEFTVCRESSLSDQQLSEFRSRFQKADPSGVIFHSRSSVTRIFTAFPSLRASTLEIVSSGRAVSLKLEKSDISPDREADGTWRSLLAEIEK